MSLFMSAFIGGVLLGGVCGLCVNRLALLYQTPAKLFLGWPSLIGGALSLSLAWRFGFSPAFWIYSAFFFALGVAAGVDILLYVLPDFITIGGTTFMAVPISVLFLGLPWPHVLAGGLMGMLCLVGLYLATLKKHGRPGIGMGDIKLMGCLGALCGVQALPQIWLVAIVAALPWMLFNIKKVPFGPFLVLGAWSWVVLPYDFSRSVWSAISILLSFIELFS